MFLPEEDRYSNSKERINSMIAALFGGRVAEEEIFGEDAVTTGASNDIERATGLARSMVTKWGLSTKLGPLAYAEEENEVFLGKSVSQQKTVSDKTADTIDSEIRSIIDMQYSRATKLIRDNLDKMHVMADALMKYETIDSNKLMRLWKVKFHPLLRAGLMMIIQILRMVVQQLQKKALLQQLQHHNTYYSSSS